MHQYECYIKFDMNMAQKQYLLWKNLPCAMNTDPRFQYRVAMEKQLLEKNSLQVKEKFKSMTGFWMCFFITSQWGKL